MLNIILFIFIKRLKIAVTYNFTIIEGVIELLKVVQNSHIKNKVLKVCKMYALPEQVLNDNKSHLSTLSSQRRIIHNQG